MSRADMQIQPHAVEHAPDGFNARSQFSADRQTERVYFVLQGRGDPLGGPGSGMAGQQAMEALASAPAAERATVRRSS